MAFVGAVVGILRVVEKLSPTDDEIDDENVESLQVLCCKFSSKPRKEALECLGCLMDDGGKSKGEAKETTLQISSNFYPISFNFIQFLDISDMLGPWLDICC